MKRILHRAAVLTGLLALLASGIAAAQLTINDGSTPRTACTSFTVQYATNQANAPTITLSPSGCLTLAPTATFNFSTTNSTQISESYAAGVANRSLTLQVDVARNGNTNPLTVDVEVCAASTGCTAVGGQDYQLDGSFPFPPPFKRTLSFAAGDVSKTFDVYLVDDLLQDGVKVLTFTLSNPTGTASIGTATATLTINDDEPPVASAASFSVGAYQISEANADGKAAIPITRTNASAGATIQVEIPATGTTAVVGTHYNINDPLSTFTGSPPTATVNFAAGQATGYVFVPTINAPTVDGNKTVALSLKNGIGVSIGSPGAAVLTILDTGSAGGETDINGAAIPIPTGPAGGTMCDFNPFTGSTAPYPGSGTGPCGSYQIPVGNCSSGMTGINTISKAWLYALEDILPGSPRLGNSIRLGVPRDAAMIFRFKTGPATAFPEFQTVGYRNLTIGYDEQSSRGPAAPHFVTISESKCDFDYTKTLAGGALNGCYVTMASAGSFLAKIWPTGGDPAPAADFPYCPLKPDTVYYLNIRYEDASAIGTRGVLNCPAGVCGAAIGFN